jgi:hypothetical protein
MGLVELLAPSYALVAGAASVVLSLLSLITALGGFGIGMLLGIIGSCCAVAWKPEGKTIRRPLFWSAFACSIVTLLGFVTLIAQGKLAIATPMVGPFTVFVGQSECYNLRVIPAISQVDHQTPVELSYADYCVQHHVVITKRIMGIAIRLTQETSIQRGVTLEIVASHSDVSHLQPLTLVSVPSGIAETAKVDVETNLTTQQLFVHIESVTNYNNSMSFV